jgi:penicillin-insensitive murein endopeptidase
MSATSVIKSRFEVNPKVWTLADARLIKRAASYPQVERIFVHPPIKKFLCEWAHDKGAWLAKVRAYYGHYAHFHIRIRCPRGSSQCKPQAPPHPKDGTGCGAELAYWLSDKPWRKPGKPVKPVKPRPPITMAQMPHACSAVLGMH